jgi:serine/threonine-protein kinase HipA
MTTMNEVRVLDVRLYGNVIGKLTLQPGDRSIFSFTEDYIADPARPALSLSFKDQAGGLIEQLRPTQTSLAPFFSNLLPEGPLRDYLARRAGVKAVREFHLLWALGQDLPGAMDVVSPDGLSWLEDVDLADHASDRPASSRALRFSLAGVQLKFSAVKAARGGLTIPVHGTGGDWIAKLPSTTYARVPENEFAMMRLAGLVGIDVPEIDLVAQDAIEGIPPELNRIDEHVFAIRRFDRTDAGERIHIEDFAQVFGIMPASKYERASYRSIAKVLAIETGNQGVEEFIRRLVFNTLIGNADMHLKNWSLIYRDRRTASLAPAYDFVSTVVYISDEYAALKYARTKKMAELSLDELAYLSAKAGLPEPLVRRAATETVERFQSAWRNEKRHLPLSQDAVSKIDAHIGSLAISKIA